MSIIYNVAKDAYIQKVDCAEIQGVVTTDPPVQITILNTQVAFTKAPDNIFVEKGEIIPYTLTFKNTSDVTLTKIEMIDVLPKGIELVPDTLKVNGSSIVGDIQTGITLSNKLLPGGQVVVSFSGIVSSVPPTTYYNTASATYYYQLNATTGQKSQTVQSNTVLAKAIQGILFVTKTTDKSEVQKKNQIIYTITIVNEGNVPATDLILTDYLPPQVRYTPNTFTLNGTLISNVDLVAGVPLGNLAVGATDIVQLTVDIIDDRDPIVSNRGNIQYFYVKDPNHPPVPNNTNSNLAVVVVHRPEITITKSTPTTTTSQGETVTYTLVVENTGTLAVTNGIITDVLPQGMTVVPGSITVDGVATTGDIIKGLNIGSIAVGAKVTVIFKALVNSVPPTTFTNRASIAYSYVLNGAPLVSSAVSNDVVITAGQQPPSGHCTDSLTATMSANKTQVQRGDHIVYQVVIKNTGSQTVSSLVLNNPLSANLMLVPNSITLNGAPVQGNLTNLAIGDLLAGGTVTISFAATVVGGCPGTMIASQASVQCTNANCTGSQCINTLQTNQVNVIVMGNHPPCPPEPCPPEPCPPEPCPPSPCPPYPDRECRIEGVITPIYLPNYMHCIDQITGITGFVKNVKPVSYGYYTKLLVTYVLKLEYINASGLYYTYQQCEEVYIDKCKYNSNTVVEIESIEQPYVVDNRCVEVIVNLSICNN